MKTRGYVLATGTRNGMGLDARQTGFFLRTGNPSITAAPLADADGESIAMSFDATLDPYLVGEARAAELGRLALAEVARPLAGMGRSLRIKVVLSLAEPRLSREGKPLASDATGLLGALLAPAVREHFGEPSIEVIARGAGGAASALASALAELERQSVDAVLFGGVHSDYDPVAIAWLSRTGRLYSPKNLDAIIPGECAAFVLIGGASLGSRITQRAMGDLEPGRAALKPMARIYGVASGWEEATPWNDRSAFSAKGLTSAVRAATRDLPDELKIGWTLADHSFELYRVHEWQAMMTHTRDIYAPPMAADAPAQRLGHMGAAALPLELVLASESLARGYAHFPLGLCFAGSDAGARAAVVVGSV
jgi:3-oxoacyl-[acyl-carrier-protein] synthase-1